MRTFQIVVATKTMMNSEGMSEVSIVCRPLTSSLHETRLDRQHRPVLSLHTVGVAGWSRFAA